MAAGSWIRFPLRENVLGALIRVDVLNSFSGRGIGQALVRHAEALANEKGRSTLLSFTEHLADFDPDGQRLLKPGTGGLPADARQVRFAVRSGYSLEQVACFSALAIARAPELLDAGEAEALAKAGTL
ncbi:hypothetical protein [Pseudarthrobacter sp. N5]|uniref:hypothetical protein n=1 Tax=Pseudarthrobacter sp. N5 TaxID=3418416 RepID=UPI003CEA2824